MNKKSMALCSLLLLSSTACSSDKNQTSTTLPEVNTPTAAVAPQTVTTPTVDDVSSATVVAAEASYEQDYQSLFQMSQQEDFLLWQAPSAETLVFQALNSTLSENPSTSLEVIHYAIQDTLGDAYESARESYLASVAEAGGTVTTLPDYENSDNYGISVIESFLPQVTGGSSALVQETAITGSATCQSARLYLPKVGTNEYYIVTIQEISTGTGEFFSFLELGTATISAFTSTMALDYLQSSISMINAEFSLELEQPVFADSSTQNSEAEPEEAGEEEVELDGMSSATPEFHLIDTKDGSGNLVQVSVAHFPNKAVYLDYSAFDVALSFGIAGSYEQIVIQDDVPSVLKSGLVDDVNFSTYLETGDLSMIEDLQPAVIFANQDVAHLYDQLSAIAPVIMTDTSEGTSFESYKENVERVSIMYSVAYIIDGFSGEYEERLNALSQSMGGQSAVVVSCTNGVLSLVSTNTELIFETVGLTDMSGAVGGATVEEIQAAAPDYVFILDNDGTAPDMAVSVVELDVPAWTLHSRGVLGMGQMISDLEKATS